MCPPSRFKDTGHFGVRHTSLNSLHLKYLVKDYLIWGAECVVVIFPQWQLPDRLLTTPGLTMGSFLQNSEDDFIEELADRFNYAINCYRGEVHQGRDTV